jgi:hypothetical protein
MMWALMPMASAVTGEEEGQCVTRSGTEVKEVASELEKTTRIKLRKGTYHA